MKCWICDKKAVIYFVVEYTFVKGKFTKRFLCNEHKNLYKDLPKMEVVKNDKI